MDSQSKMSSKRVIKSINFINRKNLPTQCPNKNFNKLSTHPKIFLCFDKKGYASCPYCSEKYQIKELFNP